MDDDGGGRGGAGHGGVRRGGGGMGAGDLRRFAARGLRGEGHMADQRYTIEPIGVVHSALTDLDDAPRQGDELLIFTWLHRAERDTLQVHPRSDLSRPLAGVFATRSPDRPNPIGLHRVTVREVGAGRLRVGPLEAIDGTPVVDIKPVLGAVADR